MNEAFIWLSGHRIIFFRIFTENNPVMGDSKTFCIPEAKGLTCFIFYDVLKVMALYA